MSARSTALSLILIASISTAGLGTALAEQPSPAKRESVKQLLESSGAGAMGKQLAAIITRQIISGLHKSRPDIPTRTLAIIERETSAIMNESMDAPGGLLDRMVPLYTATFTQEELDAMIAFYQSPVGKKTVAVMPELLRAGQQIGQQYAKDIAPVIKQRLKDALTREGVVLDRLPD